jgi:TP901 family phage tail tape measure protein
MASKLEIILSAKNETGGAINQVKSALGGLGGAAKATVTAAGVAAVGAVTGITAAVGVGVGKAMDLEQGIADIASVMGVTFDEAKPLGDLITDLGIDPMLKVDAVGASEAIMQLAQSGVDMKDIVDGAAKATVLLSNATGGDMATSAATATDAMKLFNIDAKDMSAAVDGITGVTVASKFGINDYQLALAAAGGVAATSGVEFNDFNTAITAISPNFASGSDAGTSFKEFLARLVPQSNEATEAMKSLGLITEDGKNQFYTASGEMKSMADISGILQTATQGLTEEQKNATLRVIFGSDAIRAATGLANTGAEGFNALAGSLAKVDAEASAGTRVNTLSGQMEILQGVVDGVMTKIGMAFLPVLRDLANWATDFVSNNGAALTAWFEGLAAWIKGVTPIVIAWGGFLLAALGELTNWLTGQETSFAHLTALWGWLQDAVGKAVAGVVKFIVDNLPNWISNLKQWGLEAWNWIVGAIPTVTEKLGDLWAAISTWFTWNGPILINKFKAWAETTYKWITDTAIPEVSKALGKLWGETIKPWLDTNANGLGTKLETWAGKFAKLTGDITAGFSAAWPTIQKTSDEASVAISKSINNITDSLGRMSKWFSGDGQGGTPLMTWVQFWQTLGTVVVGTAEGIVTMIEITVRSIEALGEAVRAIGAQDWGGLAHARDLAGGAVDALTGFMVEYTIKANEIGTRANGGPVMAGGRYLVGERGPELFVPQTSGTIVPNGTQTNVNNTYNVYLSGTGSAGNDVLSTVQTLQALYG